MGRSKNIRGIILGQREIKEQDTLVSILTESQGKITVKAKGLKNVKSKRIGVLQTGNTIKGIIYTRNGYHTLGQVELVYQPQTLRENLLSVGILLSLCELAENLLPQEEENKKVLNLLEKTIKNLSKSPNPKYLVNYEIRLLEILGYGIPDQAKVYLEENNLKLAQKELWNHFNLITERPLLGLGKLI